VVLGGWLMGSALMLMRAKQTTINPRGMPSALVTEGVFGISRNPIYLGDAVILLGAAFWTDAVLGLLVVAGFVWIIQDRFITVEEERLAETFGDPAAEWFVRVRRWI
jgi:protein-S-isoprenylcysteine O-methyltransferase Ste14